MLIDLIFFKIFSHHHHPNLTPNQLLPPKNLNWITFTYYLFKVVNNFFI